MVRLYLLGGAKKFFKLSCLGQLTLQVFVRDEGPDGVDEGREGAEVLTPAAETLVLEIGLIRQTRVDS